MISRIGLGTAQFGSHYGITNKTGQPNVHECYKIVDAAYKAGIRYFDTSTKYGKADMILASALGGLKDVRVVSKVNDQHDVKRSITLFDKQLYALLGDFDIKGFDGKIGRSIYWQNYPDCDLDIIQLPSNLADQRNKPYLEPYKALGVEIHVRSVFLQGLLLERGATVRQCLKFVLAQPIDVAIVGVNSVEELAHIVMAVDTLDQETNDFVPVIEPENLDPRTWRH